jgi:membrane protein insertase Oxa1/YidC/SpoIIIJ
MPVLLVMYRVIHGLIATVRVDGRLVGAPKYLDKGTDLYQDLVKSGGKMVAFGVDLSSSARVNHGSFGAALPFFVIVALVVFVQYYQSKQMTKVLPAVFGLISLSIAAGVNVYFLVSGAFRIVQQAAMYRFDPTLSAHAKSHAKEIEAKAVEVKTKPLEKRRGPPKNTSGNGGEPRPKTSAAKAKGNAGRAKQKRRSKKGR